MFCRVISKRVVWFYFQENIFHPEEWNGKTPGKQVSDIGFPASFETDQYEDCFQGNVDWWSDEKDYGLYLPRYLFHLLAFFIVFYIMSFCKIQDSFIKVVRYSDQV